VEVTHLTTATPIKVGSSEVRWKSGFKLPSPA
jgi:hypothetical protein